MMSLDELVVTHDNGKVRFQFGGMKTNWIDDEDPFIKRIGPENLNRFFLDEHLKKEIEIKNILDEGTIYLNSGKYAKAIGCFDEVLFYDENYIDALMGKSYALHGQKHFVKSLRYYKKAHNLGFTDKNYYSMLLRKSGDERSGFPPIKRNIYAGDEAADMGEYEKAIEFYDRALKNPSNFKNKILFKLLNKKASALVRLKRFDDAQSVFSASLQVHENDCAYFGEGYCRYMLEEDCEGSLKNAVKIDKRHLLVKACIFNDLGLYRDGLDAYDEFLASHFVIDDDFKAAIMGKIEASDALNMDSGGLRDILDEL